MTFFTSSSRAFGVGDADATCGSSLGVEFVVENSADGVVDGGSLVLVQFGRKDFRCGGAFGGVEVLELGNLVRGEGGYER